MDITIKELNENLLDDFLYFFEEVGFRDNPDWAWCYCVFFHHSGDADDWMARTKHDNRDLAIRLIRAGTFRGLLAYDGTNPIGWCNANEKGAFSFDKNRKGVYTDMDDRVISIVCFLISPDHRRMGLSDMLLKKVIEYYRDSGREYLEAYPAKGAKKACEDYHGPLSLYLKNNFYIEQELDGYSIVRYNLLKNHR